MVQYPLNMGKPGVKSSAVVAVSVDETGEVRFDSIVKQGSNRTRLVQSSLNDIRQAKEADLDLLALPGEKEEVETADKTRQALEALLNGKIKSSKPVSGNNVQRDPEEPTYIRYAPDPNAIGYVTYGRTYGCTYGRTYGRTYVICCDRLWQIMVGCIALMLPDAVRSFAHL